MTMNFSPAAPAIAQTARAAPIPAPATARRRVLVVDDSAVVRTLYSETLVQAGYEVHEAEDGQAALACLDGRPLDCIVCDLGMPHVDGRSFLRLLRVDPRYGRVPVLVISTDSREETRLAVRTAGAKAFISKPCHCGDLLDAVNRLCRR